MTIEWKWISGSLDDPIEGSTFASVKILIDNYVATRLFDSMSGLQRDYVNLPLYHFADNIAKNWWSILYETKKGFGAREYHKHSLDSYTPGFLFPPLAIFSGGEETIIIERTDFDARFSRIEFLPPVGGTTFFCDRDQFESELFLVVQSTLERVGKNGSLRESWMRIAQSLETPDERAYCVAAGKLGLDPYSDNSIDIERFAEGISDELFSDVCDAVSELELPSASTWARTSERDLANFPRLDIKDFGTLPKMTSVKKGYEYGYKSPTRNSC